MLTNQQHINWLGLDVITSITPSSHSAHWQKSLQLPVCPLDVTLDLTLDYRSGFCVLQIGLIIVIQRLPRISGEG